MLFFKTIFQKPGDAVEKAVLVGLKERYPEEETIVLAESLHEKWVALEDATAIDPSLHLYNTYGEETLEKAVEPVVSSYMNRVLDAAELFVDSL
jgi:hypothetical protein